MTQKLLHGQEVVPMSQDVLIDSLIDLIIRHNKISDEYCGSSNIGSRANEDNIVI